MLFAAFVACSGDDGPPPVERCVWFADDDGDGYGQSEVFHVGRCSDGAPEGFVETQSDCADANASIHPGAIEGPDGGERVCELRDELDLGVPTASLVFSPPKYGEGVTASPVFGSSRRGASGRPGGP